MEGIWLYTLNPTSERPVMLIDKHIGFDAEDGMGIMGDAFAKELMALDAMQPKCIDIWINSPGGVVSDGYNIYNAILKSKTPVDTHCVGIAASISGVIFQAGRKRIMADYSKLMYHDPFGGDNKSLDAISDSICTMICSRTATAEDEVRKMMKRTTWIGADEALASGFCDEVQNSGEVNKKRAQKASDAKALWSVSADIMNKDIDSNFSTNKNSSKMKTIANKLNLNAEASEGAIVEQIESIQNKSKEQETAIAAHLKTIKDKDDAIAAAKAEVEAKEKELTELKNKLAGIEAENKKKEDEAKAEAEKKSAEKAKNLIEGFATQGRIKNDEATKNAWIEKAKADFDGVKNLIEGLPINKQGAKIEISSVSNNAKLTSVVANKMAEKRAQAQGVKI